MKLMTWNIQWGRGADGRVDLDRMVEHARDFAHADVYCFQEVSAGFPDLPGSDGSDQFAGIAARFPQHRAIDGLAVDLDDGRRRFGNMILSRYPVLRVCRHLLPWPAEPGVQSMQRIAIEATLDTPLGPLRVTTTHLEYYSASQRMAQVARLRELDHEAVAHAHCPAAAGKGPFSGPPRTESAVLAGDFNFKPDSAEWRSLTTPSPGWPRCFDAWTLVHPGVPHAPTIGVHDKEQWPGPAYTCDYWFVSEDLAARVDQVRTDHMTDASDHQPLLLVLRT